MYIYITVTVYLCSGIKKKKKHKKKSKRRHESISSKSSDSGPTKIKLTKFDDDDDNFGILKADEAKLLDLMSEKEIMNNMTKFEDQLPINQDSNIVDKIVDGSVSPLLPPISKKMDDESDEPIIPKVLGLLIC